MEPTLEELAEKTMEGYQKRADDFGREVEIFLPKGMIFICWTDLLR